MSTSASSNNSTKIHHDQQDDQIMRLLKQLGILNASKIANSLQGSIWRARIPVHDTDLAPVVIKVADRYLQQSSLAQLGHRFVKVDEDVVSEAKLLKRVSQRADCPASIVKFYQFFKSKTDYYLVMEDGGSALFEFIEQAHKYITAGKIDVSHWQKAVKVIFEQMVECIDFLHAHNIAHMDISLENFLINDVEIKKTNDSKIELVLEDIHVKLCDFGLAKAFDGDFRCNKFCGKKGYQSPEVVAKKHGFDAKKNDVWCLAVCLFMMKTGTAPWERASPSDDLFVCMTNGFMKGTLKSWDLLHLVDELVLDLFECVFQSEAERIGLDEIRGHAWWKHEK